MCGKVVVERKSSDFLDFQRVRSQASIMQSTYGRNAFLVIERSLADIIEESTYHFQRDMTNQILGFVASLSVRTGIVPIFCSNPKYAAYIIKSLCQKGNDDKSTTMKLSRPRVKREDKLIHFLCGLPHVDITMAERLLARFGSIQAISQASQEELIEVEGIGKTKAEKIYSLMR